jgi:transcriptional regulator PpsR
MDLPPPPSSGPLSFRDPSRALSGIASEATARILSATGDVTLVLDRSGIIRDVAVGSNELGEDPFSSWIDRPFIDTVSSDSRIKIEEMLRDVASRTTPRWRQVNHPAGNSSVPVRYLAMEAGDNGRVIAIGRDMRAAAALQQRLIQAQQSMERDYVRLRQTEQRYRLLFDLCSEPVLIVDAATRKISEANPAAIALGGAKTPIEGQSFPGIFSAESRDDLLELMGAVASGSAQMPVPLALADGRIVTVAATLFRQDRTSHLLVRLGLGARAGEAAPQSEALAEVLDRIPDAFILTDPKLVIRSANTAFLDLTHSPHLEQVIGQSLGQFLGRPEIDIELLQSQLRTSGEVRNFDAVIRGRHGEREDVELTAVSVNRQGETHYGFAIRSVARRMDRAASDVTGVPRSVEQLTELVGRVSLKDIVRESTDLIERLCIEAALRYTSNNRASAAEILGLSRQSLYSKLHRHGMASPSVDAPDDQED